MLRHYSCHLQGNSILMRKIVDWRRPLALKDDTFPDISMNCLIKFSNILLTSTIPVMLHVLEGLKYDLDGL